MPKGYWIVRMDISDPEAFKKYQAANAEGLRKYGAHFVVRAGRSETVEGISRARNLVVEFSSYEVALECWKSPETQAAIKLRTSISTADLLIIEGYDGPQPG